MSARPSKICPLARGCWIPKPGESIWKLTVLSPGSALVFTSQPTTDLLFQVTRAKPR